MKRTAVIRRIIVAWILLIGLIGWLPFVRGLFDGATYVWNTGYFGIELGGAGVGGDFWYPPLKTAVSLFVLFALLRRWRPLGAVLATVWTGILLVDNVVFYFINPDGFWFRGDTLGIEINLALVAPLFTGAMLLLCGYFWRQSAVEGARGPYPLQRPNMWRLGLLAALLPIQFILLRFGEPHGTTDQAGVVLTILQWLSLGWALGVTGVEEDEAAQAGIVHERS